ncbi:hypothetical protein ACFE04_030878 [Oxalis oulophora]
MDNIFFAKWSLIFLVVLSSLILGQCQSATHSQKKVYLVETDASRKFTELNYVAILHKVAPNCKPKQCLVYVYNNVIPGFAARLTEQEATKLASVPGVLAVIPDKHFQIGDGLISPVA